MTTKESDYVMALEQADVDFNHWNLNHRGADRCRPSALCAAGLPLIVCWASHGLCCDRRTRYNKHSPASKRKFQSKFDAQSVDL
jgi:hypothetical protein